jgi:hypothetical protein
MTEHKTPPGPWPGRTIGCGLGGGQRCRSRRPLFGRRRRPAARSDRSRTGVDHDSPGHGDTDPGAGDHGRRGTAAGSAILHLPRHTNPTRPPEASRRSAARHAADSFPRPTPRSPHAQCLAPALVPDGPIPAALPPLSSSISPPTSRNRGRR